jgi:hypothetical protein
MWLVLSRQHGPVLVSLSSGGAFPCLHSARRQAAARGCRSVPASPASTSETANRPCRRGEAH